MNNSDNKNMVDDDDEQGALDLLYGEHSQLLPQEDDSIAILSLYHLLFFPFFSLLI
jgi:hypothetical protein